ncbi:MAG: nitroreductase family protein [bacterium]
METIEAIYTRRSIRKYASEPISEEMIHELLTAAMYAPSAGNQQPWHFVVITERRLLDAIPSFHPHAKMLKQAPVAILVCGDPTLEKYKGRWMLDCSAATQNILLAAHARGLGTVWVGIYPERERIENMQRLLNLPPHIIPLALIPIGYPAEHVPQPERFHISKIHYNQW